jgi:hypothetical protein
MGTGIRVIERRSEPLSSVRLEDAEPAPRARRWRHALVALNVLGGLAVLGSYTDGLARPGAAAVLWGGVPEGLRPLYTGSMLLAALGYFPMTGAVLFGLDAGRARVAGRFDYRLFVLLYALILVPSALWMPLTFQMVDTPSPLLWAAIRAVLALVGIGSLGVLAALARVQPGPPRGLRGLALAGAAAFCLQTVVLDALVWPAFFPR